MPTILTWCSSCLLSSFPGIDGLLVGAGLPSYGSVVRFGNILTTTTFDPDEVLGYNLPFNSKSVLMQRDSDVQRE